MSGWCASYTSDDHSAGHAIFDPEESFKEDIEGEPCNSPLQGKQLDAFKEMRKRIWKEIPKEIREKINKKATISKV